MKICFHALQIFDSFSKISGLEVNKQKSEAMYLGNKKNCTDQIFGFTLTTKLKILGIYFSNTQSASCVEENWTGRIKVIKSLISLWEKRNLSIMGKTIIIKTFLLPQLTYFMQAFIIPEKVLTEVNRLLYRFLWRKKDCNKKAFEKVKRAVICNETEFGGLNMIDIKQMQLSFMLQWGVVFCNTKTVDKWSITPRLMYI